MSQPPCFLATTPILYIVSLFNFGHRQLLPFLSSFTVIIAFVFFLRAVYHLGLGSLHDFISCTLYDTLPSPLEILFDITRRITTEESEEEARGLSLQRKLSMRMLTVLFIDV